MPITYLKTDRHIADVILIPEIAELAKSSSGAASVDLAAPEYGEVTASPQRDFFPETWLWKLSER